MTPGPLCQRCGHDEPTHTTPPRGMKYDGQGCFGHVIVGHGTLSGPDAEPPSTGRCYCPGFIPFGTVMS